MLDHQNLPTMKRLSLLLAIAGFFSHFGNAQSFTFTRTYGGTRYDDVRSIAPAADGGFVFTGLCKSAADSLGDMYLSKINAAGALLWTKYYGRPAEDGGNNVLPTSDGGFLLTGHTAFSYGEDCDGYLLKTDADGNEQWRVFLGTVLDDVSDQSVETADGCFFVTGRTEDPETHTFRALLAKIDAKGNYIFQKGLSAEQPELAISMAQTPDGHLFLTGYVYSPDHKQADKMLLIKCDPAGNLLWRKIWGSTLDERAYGVVSTPDGGCYVVGRTADALGNYLQMSVNRFSADGDLLAQGTIMDQGAGHLSAAALTPLGQLAIAGDLRLPGDTYAKPFFALLNEDLSIQEWRTLDLPAETRTRCISISPAGDFVLGGNFTTGDGKTKAFLGKISGTNNVSAVKDVAEQPYLLFPNPFHDASYLKVGIAGQPKTLRIYTPDGKLAREETFDTEEYLLYKNGLQPGAYVLTVLDQNGRLLASNQIQILPD